MLCINPVVVCFVVIETNFWNGKRFYFLGKYKLLPYLQSIYLLEEKVWLVVLMNIQKTIKQIRIKVIAFSLFKLDYQV